MSSEEQLRALVEKIDVARAPRAVAALEHVLEVLPEARDLFTPGIAGVIAAIRAHQKEERAKWLQA